MRGLCSLHRNCFCVETYRDSAQVADRVVGGFFGGIAQQHIRGGEAALLVIARIAVHVGGSVY